MYFLYILYSSNSDKYYVGVTENPERRLSEHNTSERTTYTSKHRPWIMVALFEVKENWGVALKIEKFIKKQKSRTFIEALVLKNDIPAALALLVRVPISGLIRTVSPATDNRK
jgi:putative endonuclease